MSDDLASAFMPEGIAVDDANRHVAGQLALAWLQISPAARRLVIEYERCLDPAKAAELAGFESGRVAETALAAEKVRQVLSLRSLLTTETIPPAMIGRVLTRIALGLVPSTPHAQVRASIELARVQGAYVPPQTRDQAPGADETGLEQLDQDAQDRIVRAHYGGGVDFAQLVRQRVRQALDDQAAADAADATQAEVESIEAQAAAHKPRRQKYKPRPAPIDPVLGTVPRHLANPAAPESDALAIARAKMRGRG